MLVTLYGNFNYGNVLQRCALSRTIESLGFEVRHLCFQDKVLPFGARAKSFIKQIIKQIIYPAVNIFPSVGRIFASGYHIRQFQNKYITRRINALSYEQVLNADPSEWAEYDYAVTGSDQVWHLWAHTAEEADYFYLSFIPRAKRVCYAPSFGFPEFPESDYEFHKKGLAGFERISCREQEMIPMIKRISGKDAQLTLDPTLLIDASQWRAYERKPGYDVPEKYVFCYFLDVPPEDTSAILKMAGDMPVIAIDGFGLKGGLQYRTGPEGFLWLIDHADFVCTNSFHGTAFSVNFGKNFLSFRRKGGGMFGRISGLLSSLNITGHIYEPGMQLRPDNVNYDEAYAKLDALRESSMNYLRENLR